MSSPERTVDDSDEEIDWEEWKPNEISFYHHMLAGSIAGLAEHITLFPVDTIKTNIQCQKCGSTSPFNCAARLIREEGVFRLWRGVTATFSGCIPAHAAYFSIYEAMRRGLGADKKDQHQPILAGLCGASASTAHDFFMNPFDVIKQRMQLGYYRNTYECMKVILRTEGIGAFYVSFPTTLMTNIPHGCFVVAANESARKILNPSGHYNITSSLIAGCFAGGFAAACTTPLDVIKTRLQTQNLVPCVELEKEIKASGNSHTFPEKGSNSNNFSCGIAKQCSNANSSCHSGNNSINVPTNSSSSSSRVGSSSLFEGGIQVNKMRYHTYPELSAASTMKYNPQSLSEAISSNYQAIRTVLLRIISEEGYAGLWRGLGPRVVNQAPAVAISWTVYESAKATFGWQASSSSSGVSYD